MKPRKLSKKLTLNKTTIASLSNAEAQKVHAGGDATVPITCGSCRISQCCLTQTIPCTLTTCGSGIPHCDCIAD